MSRPVGVARRVRRPCSSWRWPACCCSSASALGVVAGDGGRAPAGAGRRRPGGARRCLGRGPRAATACEAADTVAAAQRRRGSWRCREAAGDVTVEVVVTGPRWLGQQGDLDGRGPRRARRRAVRSRCCRRRRGACPRPPCRASRTAPRASCSRGGAGASASRRTWRSTSPTGPPRRQPSADEEDREGAEVLRRGTRPSRSLPNIAATMANAPNRIRSRPSDEHGGRLPPPELTRRGARRAGVRRPACRAGCSGCRTWATGCTTGSRRRTRTTRSPRGWRPATRRAARKPRSANPAPPGWPS